MIARGLPALLAMLVPQAARAVSTPLAAADLDPATFAAWVAGAETRDGLPRRGPGHVLWTSDSHPEYGGAIFGAGTAAGPRHLRIGFTRPIPVGTVVVRGGGSLSVLQPEAEYPGRIDAEELWLSAKRIAGDAVVSSEAGRDELALWVLPPGTATRALRFTHVPAAADNEYAGWLGGAWIAEPRLANLAPQALVEASAEGQKAERLTNGAEDGWGAWDNGPEGGERPVAEDPPALTLVWPASVRLSSIMTLWSGFGAARVEAYTGPADQHPRAAAPEQWRPVADAAGLKSGYPLALWPNWFDCAAPLETRAVRVLLGAVAPEDHPHLVGKGHDGRRVWLGELLALTDLGDEPLAAALPAREAEAPPPVAVRFRLPEAGRVTLVIERPDGTRVRNLVCDEPFEAGDNIAWWDGTDDLGRDPEAAEHGIYHVPGRFVEPGRYRVRGLYHAPLRLAYEFTVYTAGEPPWETADKSGGWLTNHTPPSAVAAVRAPEPMMLLGSYVSEGGAGLAWVDESGRKRSGQGWVGGNWTGAPYIAGDLGENPVPGVYAYVGSAWDGELRLTSIAASEQKPVLAEAYKLPPDEAPRQGDAPVDREIAGLAARDGRLLVSLRRLGKLLYIDAADHRVLGERAVEDPRGIAAEADGSWLVLSGSRLLRYGADPLAGQPEAVVEGLEDPQALAVGAGGRIYVSVRGTRHQVLVYDAAGRPLRAVGHPGAPQAGPYDALHLNNPRGIALDTAGRLWVAEEDYQPKRVSIWNEDGTLWRAFYGPAEYGGGGRLDGSDPERFYYHGMEFGLDWAAGTFALKHVYWRPGADVSLPDGHFANGYPETPVYFGGRQYLHNAFNSCPTQGTWTVTIWRLDDGLARPVAAVGRVRDWSLLKEWHPGDEPTMFAWTDTDGDGRPSPGEVTYRQADSGGVTVMGDLSLVITRVAGQTERLIPTFDRTGVPRYQLDRGLVLASDVHPPASTGGDQALWAADAELVHTLGVGEYPGTSIVGVADGRPRWSYPNLWPGLHASHVSPPPDRPGQVIGVTRLLGEFLRPKGAQVGPVWAVNGNQGNIYLFTHDGLFIGELFHDVRQAPQWKMPVAERGMDVGGLTLHDENFWPSITQTDAGPIYLCDGARGAIVRLDGLESLRPLEAGELTVTEADLAAARTWQLEREARRQAEAGPSTLIIARPAVAPAVDGRLDDWAGATWVDIDRRGVAAYFDANTKPYDVRGAVAVDGDRLYAAWRTGDAELLRNSGELPQAPFKTGGALDLMIGCDPAADPARAQPVPGDVRLLITRVGDGVRAVLYRAVVPGTAQPVPFSSPWRTITLDVVEDVSAQIELAGADGDYEASVPLALLGLRPQAGVTISGDIGLLRGDGGQTTQRVYWSNKATAIVADVPSEAELTPRLWGRWRFAP